MENSKARFRNISWLYRANARLKCWQTKRRYSATLKRYSNMASTSSDAPLVNLHLADWGSRRPRVFFMGTDEQQDKSGFIQAIQRVADV